MKLTQQQIAVRMSQPWAVAEEFLPELVSSIGGPFVRNGDEPHARKVMAQGRKKSVALMRLHGVFEKDSFWDLDTSAVAGVFRSFAQDENVGGIVLDVNSPGGSVYGVPEFASEILEARKKKPVIAVANGMAASAAFWIAAAASKLIATPSSQVGSVGVYLMHMDISKMMENLGIVPTFIHAGRFKVEGNSYQPMSEAGKEHAQATVDAYYQQFVGAVAKGRVVSVSVVKKDFGQGRLLMAEDALKAGMIDELGSVESAIYGLASSVGMVSANEADIRRRRFSLQQQKNGLTASR